ncbi:hypothetical protein FOFC_03056 [Fusarium oxysporum]|nr:hypothetical protein FOFC_21511 [Fusarium oxysporum]KAI8416743.1 hypothetical protein FOFC_03056 [Fusarium oxysporum]
MPLSVVRFFKSIRVQRTICCINSCLINYGLNASLIDGDNVLFVRETGPASVPKCQILR